MDKDAALDLALEALEYASTGNRRPEIIGSAITAIKQARSAPVQEPIGYLFQHEETGLTMVVDVQQVEWGFEKNNPRHQKIGPVYTAQPAAQRQWTGLTDEMVTAAARALNKRQAEACGVDKNDHWKFYGDDIKEDARAALEAAHNIKEKNT